MARFFLGIWEDAEARTGMLALLRSAVSHDAAAMLREFITEAVLGPIAGAPEPAGR